MTEELSKLLDRWRYMDIDVKNLHPLEVKLLRHVDLGSEITAD